MEVWSAEITINKETGETKGFIFATYTEAGLDGSSTTINTSVLQASLNGTLDFKSLDFKGRITGDIAADRDDYFSGPIEPEITGRLSEDNAVFTGNFTTPSYVIFDFTLKKVKDFLILFSLFSFLTLQTIFMVRQAAAGKFRTGLLNLNYGIFIRELNFFSEEITTIE